MNTFRIEAAPRSLRRRGFCALALAALAVPALPVFAQDEIKPPFVTTPDEVVQRMLRLADTRAADRVFDLGSGDGRIVLAAARDFGAQATGIELDPGLVIQSAERARLAGLAHRARFLHDDVLRADISSATVVTMYLLPWLLDKLQPRLLYELRPGTRLVSHAFLMPGWLPDKTETVKLSRRHEMQGDTSRIFLWVVPAQVRGRWRAEPSPGGGAWQLAIAQNFQSVEIEAWADGRPVPVERPALSGTRLEFTLGKRRYRGVLEGDRIVGALEGDGGAAPLVFTRGG